MTQTTQNPDEIIEEIIKTYPETEWLTRCQSALPDLDEAYLMSSIEIFNGGDLIEIPESNT